MKLTKSQMDKLKEHSKEHGGLNSKHMRAMKRMMEDGMSFSKAHREAMKMEDPKSKSKPMKGLTEKQKKLPKKLKEGNSKSKPKKKNKSKY